MLLLSCFCSSGKVEAKTTPFTAVEVISRLFKVAKRHKDLLLLLLLPAAAAAAAAATKAIRHYSKIKQYDSTIYRAWPLYECTAAKAIDPTPPGTAEIYVLRSIIQYLKISLWGITVEVPL